MKKKKHLKYMLLTGQKSLTIGVVVPVPFLDLVHIAVHFGILPNSQFASQAAKFW